MSIELLKSIQEAEDKAEAIKSEAQREARDIIKGVDEVITQNKRQAALESRALYQTLLEKERADIQSQIDSEKGERELRKDNLILMANQHMEDAVALIIKKVISDGNR